MTFHVTYTSQTEKCAREKWAVQWISFCLSLSHTHTHTHTHGCNSAVGQEKEHWEHPGPQCILLALYPSHLQRQKLHFPVCVSVIQSCLTLCDPTDCSPPDSSVCGTFQARILEWVTMPFSRGSSQPRDWTRVSHISGRFLTFWATRETTFLTLAKYFLALL